MSRDTRSWRRHRAVSSRICPIAGFFYGCRRPCVRLGVNGTYLATEYLVNGGRLFERALVDDALSHLLHEEHERVQRLLDVVPPRRAARGRRPGRSRRTTAAPGRRQAVRGRGVVAGTRRRRRRRTIAAVRLISQPPAQSNPAGLSTTATRLARISRHGATT